MHLIPIDPARVSLPKTDKASQIEKPDNFLISKKNTVLRLPEKAGHVARENTNKAEMSNMHRLNTPAPVDKNAGGKPAHENYTGFQCQIATLDSKF